MTTSLRNLVTAAATSVVLAAATMAGASTADARSTRVVGTYHPAPGSYQLRVGLHAVWAATVDEAHYSLIYRIDPVSHRMRRIASLPFPGGGMSLGFGSLWVSDYFENEVWRLSPDGHVEATIRVGLQPEWSHAAFGSMWVANHHGSSLSRIDPASDTVQDTIPAGAPDTFRSGPQDVTSDATHVFVGSSNQQVLQSVDPASDHVTTPPATDDVFCGSLAAIDGYVWSADECSSKTYQFSTDGTIHHSYRSTGFPASLTTHRGQLWIGDDTVADPNTGTGSHAVLERRDPSTGALLRRIVIGGDATGLVAGFGDLWVYDANANTIRRIRV
jgi:hypothetical protein